jgi:hypothetical protein
MSMSPFLSVRCPCQEALAWVNQRLAEANYRSVQTFDLHEARTGSSSCTCPNHGTAECDCQMIVLLVYGGASQPATLILHGNDGQTWLSIGDLPPGDHRLVQTLRQALDPQTLTPRGYGER